jgi:hypothetical protein
MTQPYIQALSCIQAPAGVVAQSPCIGGSTRPTDVKSIASPSWCSEWPGGIEYVLAASPSIAT